MLVVLGTDPNRAPPVEADGWDSAAGRGEETVVNMDGSCEGPAVGLWWPAFALLRSYLLEPDRIFIGIYKKSMTGVFLEEHFILWGVVVV